MTEFLVVTLLVLLATVVGFIIGWDAGTKDTERRWRDAVGRKNDGYQFGPMGYGQ